MTSAHNITSDPKSLLRLPFLSFQEQTERPSWTIRGPEDASRNMTFDPVLWTSEFDALVAAACAGRGFALLPEELTRKPIEEAHLVQILPEWHCEDLLVHLVFPSNRGLPLAVRVFIDYIVDDAGKNESRA